MITEEMAIEWLAAKHAEEQAKERRLAIESVIDEAAEIPDGKMSATFKTGSFKVRVAHGFCYTFSPEFSGLSDAAKNKIADLKPQFSEAKYRSLSSDEARFFADYVTAKPRKPSITISEV